MRNILRRAKDALIESQSEKEKLGQESEAQSGGVFNKLKDLLIEDGSEEQGAKQPERSPAPPVTANPKPSQSVLQLEVQPTQNNKALQSSAPPKPINSNGQTTAPPAQPSAANQQGGITPPLLASAQVKFNAIYEEAGVCPPAFTAEKFLDMLSRLPSELSIDQKHLTVMAALDAMGKEFGATMESLIADARAKAAALTAHMENTAKQAEASASVTEAEIAALQAQIQKKVKAIEDTRREEEETKRACQVESDRLQSVLSFFGQNTTSSKSL